MKKRKFDKNTFDLAESLGLTPADAIEWEIRYSVNDKIVSCFEKSDVTISDLAKIAGTSRARITNILKKKSEGISLDVMLRVLGALGQSVKLQYKKVS